MHQILSDIKTQLHSVIAQLQSAVPNDEPFGVAHGNWSFPGLTRVEIIEEVQDLIDKIEHFGADELGAAEARLKDYDRRISHLIQHTIPQIWGNSGQALSAFFFTLDGLKRALAPVLNDSKVQLDASAKIKNLTAQLRGMEARLAGLSPRTKSLEEILVRIEAASEAADRLPMDLESLSEARVKVSDLLRDAERDQNDLIQIRVAANTLDSTLKASADEAGKVLEKCESAYSASTSVGLAAAFSERSKALASSMWFWVVGLVVALGAGSIFGSAQLHTLSELLKLPDLSPAVVILNFLLSILSVAAPVWFSWLATKQIGQRFRLAEDYAFKAAISRAYEGFRREAARFDKDMEAKLLTSALARLDELPLRYVETDTHGSPWHELASSPLIKDAIK